MWSSHSCHSRHSYILIKKVRKFVICVFFLPNLKFMCFSENLSLPHNASNSLQIKLTGVMWVEIFVSIIFDGIQKIRQLNAFLCHMTFDIQNIKLSMKLVEMLANCCLPKYYVYKENMFRVYLYFDLYMIYIKVF